MSFEVADRQISFCCCFQSCKCSAAKFKKELNNKILFICDFLFAPKDWFLKMIIVDLLSILCWFVSFSKILRSSAFVFEQFRAVLTWFLKWRSDLLCINDDVIIFRRFWLYLKNEQLFDQFFLWCQFRRMEEKNQDLNSWDLRRQNCEKIAWNEEMLWTLFFCELRSSSRTAKRGSNLNFRCNVAANS